MNKVILQGRLTRDPEVKYSTGEKATAIASFSMAVDRRFKKDGEQNADFINCKACGKTAETVEKYVQKGVKITVCGRIQTGSYTNKDGVKVYTTDVIVEGFDFCENKGTSQQQERPTENVGSADFMTISDSLEEELPFC